MLRHTSQNIRTEIFFKASVQKPKVLIPKSILDILKFGVMTDKDPEKERAGNNKERRTKALKKQVLSTRLAAIKLCNKGQSVHFML